MEEAERLVVSPSPNDQKYLFIGAPATSVLRSVKRTASGAQPEPGVKL
jgi:hypothetical protein